MIFLLQDDPPHKSIPSNRSQLKKIEEEEKSQHGCVRWALREHLTPPCSDFASGGLEDYHHINKKNRI